MVKSYVKSLKEYEEPSEFDASSILEAMKKGSSKKKPTSVALDENTIKQLKKIASKLDVPYQVLMRMFILEGIKKMKGVA